MRQLADAVRRAQLAARGVEQAGVHFAPRHGQQAALPHSGSKLPQSTVAAAIFYTVSERHRGSGPLAPLALRTARSAIPARFLTATALLCVLLFSGCKKEDAAFEMMPPPAAPAVLQKYWAVPDFTLTERSGQSVKLADLAGKVWVADFFYTTCPGPCPMLSSRLSDVQKELSSEPDLRLVSISTDPEKDTPEVLKLYAERFKAADRWLFLTGPKADIFSLARDGFKLPIAEPASPGAQIIHSTRLILIDRTGTVRGFYEATGETGVRDLIRDIRTVLGEK